ncbi:MAG: B12-binding domain-containing radical SAM protein [Thermoplasmatales archaeon]|nr:B12-binding domain-containing radical SAM protein [Thermoplasmatales archaeon]
MSPPGRSTAPRVLLVDPYMAREDPMERKFIELYPSLGLLTLGAYLREHGVAVEAVDLTFSRSTKPVADRIARFKPDIVGVHTKTLTRERAIKIATLARTGGALALAGGPDAASATYGYLEAGFDAVVPGEGEAALTDLAHAVHSGSWPEKVAGVAYREHGRVVRGPPRPFLRDLDELPLPAWDLVDMPGYLGRWERATGERRAAVLTSRGCPFDCSWCSKPTFGRTFRQQSPARVIEELRALHERYGVNYVRFCDDVFGIQRSWLDDLLTRMKEEDLGMKFECLARVDLLKPDLLARMRAAGLERVYVGVESGSQKMLDLMNRGTKLAQVERTAEALRREGIRQFWFLMLGYPGETLEDIDATLRLFRRFSPEEYSVSIAVPVPGTRFFEQVKGSARAPGPHAGSEGGRTLLFDGMYPQRLYRWEQRRFRLEAALGRARSKLGDRMVGRIGKIADRFHKSVAAPLLTGDAPKGS